MSLCHLMQFKLSFVQIPNRTDIAANRLDLGDQNVQLFT
jgi:hypothetical protein